MCVVQCSSSSNYNEQLATMAQLTTSTSTSIWTWIWFSLLLLFLLPVLKFVAALTRLLLLPPLPLPPLLIVLHISLALRPFVGSAAPSPFFGYKLNLVPNAEPHSVRQRQGVHKQQTIEGYHIRLHRISIYINRFEF